EAFRLGDHDYRLPGIGSYMSVALDQGNATAVLLAIFAMVLMIVCLDQLLWRPLVVWVEKFRLDDTTGGGPAPGAWVLEFLRSALVSSAALTFVRVMGAVVVSTAWAVPAGVWIGRSPRLARALQPVIQVVASFPAPMLFPLVILLFERIGVGLGFGAVALMVLAGQWYILFNVISAVAAIP